MTYEARSAPETPLLTDLYQLNMVQAYLDAGMTETAVFEFFVRRLPKSRGFLIAAGLAQAVEYFRDFRFGEADLAWIRRSERFGANFVDYLAQVRFTGDVDAMAEGTVFFADEPVVRVVAPLLLAQLVETRLINIVHFQTLVASKAARMVLAAEGKTLIDFGLRRAHGAEAGLFAARAAFVAGFDGTATVAAEPTFGVPVFGTMAHAFVQAHDDETQAFERFARSRPENVVLLIDTYDTEAGARKVVDLAPRLAVDGIAVRGVRIDSGDLAAHARAVRAILDAGGLKDVRIFASGGIDEYQLARFSASRAPIDGYGVGTSLVTSEDAPALDCAYKLQEYAGIARRKRSEGKATWPGRKQVYRRLGTDGAFAGDVLTCDSDGRAGEALVRPILRGGHLVEPLPDLEAIRRYAADQLACLPDHLRHLGTEPAYPVAVAPALRALTDEADRRAVSV